MKKLLIAIGLVVFSSQVFAVPVKYVGTVLDNNWTNYSLVHLGASPSGSGSKNDWLRFASNQEFEFYFDADTGILTTAGTQTFDLFSVNGNTATFELVSLTVDTNDSNGFVSGSMEYNFSGVSGGPITTLGSNGTFTFDNINMGVFNSTNFAGGVLSGAFMWGGDQLNDLGIDFAFDGVAVPAPAALVLMVVGLLGLGVSRKRK